MALLDREKDLPGKGQFRVPTFGPLLQEDLLVQATILFPHHPRARYHTRHLLQLRAC